LLEALEAQLAREESSLARMTEQLQRHAARVAELRERLQALADPGRPGSSPPVPAETDYRLSRCEGFEVESPVRRVGFVEGLRYHSRIDRPDALEVRAGPFGRQLLLVPVEEVDQILFEEGRLLLRSTPHLRYERLSGLLERLRSRRRRAA
jgi:hypothetical protein